MYKTNIDLHLHPDESPGWANEKQSRMEWISSYICECQPLHVFHQLGAVVSNMISICCIMIMHSIAHRNESCLWCRDRWRVQARIPLIPKLIYGSMNHQETKGSLGHMLSLMSGQAIRAVQVWNMTPRRFNTRVQRCSLYSQRKNKWSRVSKNLSQKQHEVPPQEERRFRVGRRLSWAIHFWKAWHGMCPGNQTIFSQPYGE